MSTTPNFELLKDAYAIIGGIPENKFALHSILCKGGPEHPCRTIACAAGWLGLHPQFKALGYETTRNGDTLYKGKSMVYYESTRRLFDISQYDAKNLFCPRGLSKYDAPYRFIRDTSDRDLWLCRVREYLREHGQLKEQLMEEGNLHVG